MVGKFHQEVNFVAFVRAIFDKIKLLTKFFHKTASVGSEMFMNVKINDKQKSKTTNFELSGEKNFS